MKSQGFLSSLAIVVLCALIGTPGYSYDTPYSDSSSDYEISETPGGDDPLAEIPPYQAEAVTEAAKSAHMHVEEVLVDLDQAAYMSGRNVPELLSDLEQSAAENGVGLSTAIAAVVGDPSGSPVPSPTPAASSTATPTMSPTPLPTVTPSASSGSCRNARDLLSCCMSCSYTYLGCENIAWE